MGLAKFSPNSMVVKVTSPPPIPQETVESPSQSLPSSQSSLSPSSPYTQLTEEEEEEEEEVTSSGVIVSSVFCVIQMMIDAFKENISPILYLDASFCHDSSKLICALFMDANHHIQPIACHVCGEETITTYLILLTVLMERGLKDIPNLTFCSDGSTAIRGAIKAIGDKYKCEYKHIICTQHILRNLSAHLRRNGINPKKKENKNVYRQICSIFWKARNAGTKKLCEYYLSMLKTVCPIAYEYLIKWGPDLYMWTYGYPHFQQDTNNPCESLMKLLREPGKYGKKVRASNLYNAIVRFIALSFRCMEGRLMQLDSHVVPDGEKTVFPFVEWGSWVIQALTKLGKEYELKKAMYQFKGFVFDDDDESSDCEDEEDEEDEEIVGNLQDWNGEKVKIWDAIWGKTFVVDMNGRSCTCGLFQDVGHPCIHAIAILHQSKRFGDVMDYVNEGYKQQSILKTCPKLKEKYMKEICNLSRQSHERIAKRVARYSNTRVVYWSNLAVLSSRIPSHGEAERSLFLGRSISTKLKNSILRRLQTIKAINTD